MTPLRPFLIPAVLPIAMVCAAAASSRVAGERPVITPQESRGAQIAIEACSACHAVQSAGASPQALAPPFRDLRRSYSPLNLERHMADVVRKGINEMPPQVALAPEDARAVVAYIDYLRSAP